MSIFTRQMIAGEPVTIFGDGTKTATWLGVTFAAAVPAVRYAFASLVRAGVYPADLRAAFASC